MADTFVYVYAYVLAARNQLDLGDLSDSRRVHLARYLGLNRVARFRARRYLDPDPAQFGAEIEALQKIANNLRISHTFTGKFG